MVKKIVVGSLVLTVVGGLIFGRDAVSYVRTGFTSVQDTVRSNVPLEFEIERAKQEVAELLPEIRKSVTSIAQQQVEVERLSKAIENREKALAEQEEAIMSLSDDLKSGDEMFVYAGHRYTQSEVEKDLAERFNRFKIAEDTLKRERELLVSKESALASHREALESMLSQRKGFEVELERLQARLRTIEARKQISTLEIDDSQLAHVKGVISEIDKRLDVEDAVLAAEGNFSGLIPVEKDAEQEATEGIALRVDEYFHGRSAEATELVSTEK
ncbi:MAG: hypothetical protein KDA66_08260 [Planctomycetaceae bacterium]|nr:hypothetical protein [Planctomycetaceae bacterium]